MLAVFLKSDIKRCWQCQASSQAPLNPNLKKAQPGCKNECDKT